MTPKGDSDSAVESSRMEPSGSGKLMMSYYDAKHIFYINCIHDFHYICLKHTIVNLK